jgi:hypothetical protein
MVDDKDTGPGKLDEVVLAIADKIDRADADLRKAHEPTIAEAQAAIKRGELQRAAVLFETIAAAYRERFKIHHQVDYWLSRAADCRTAAKLAAKVRRQRKGRRK